MQTHLNNTHCQQRISNNSLLELLAALMIGVIGMTITLSAGDNLIAYGGGLLIMLLVIVRLSLDCLNAYQDYKDRVKKKDQ